MVDFGPHSLYLRCLGLTNNLKLDWFVLKHTILGRHVPMYRITEDRPECDNIEMAELFRRPSELKVRALLAAISLASNMSEPEWMSLYHMIQLLRFDAFEKYSVSHRRHRFACGRVGQEASGQVRIARAAVGDGKGAGRRRADGKRRLR